MADEEHGAGIIGDQLLEEIQRLHVEIVGRLVEDEEVRRRRQRLGQEQARPLAARQLAGGSADLLGREQEVAQIADHMARLAIDHHLVAATIGDRVLHRQIVGQRRALLIEEGEVEIGAELHPAGIRLQLADQHFQEGRLADAVRADEADPVAPGDAGGEIIDQRAAVIGLRHVEGLDHQLAALARGAGLHRHLADGAAGVAALLAQIVEGAEPAHVAGAPRAHAIAQPVLLAHDLAVELLQVALFLFQHLVAPGLEGPEALVEALGRAAVDPDGGAGDAFQEAAVMADDDDGALHLAHLVFQPFDGRQVEMVGRLVEQHDVRLGRQGARQSGTAGLAARQVMRLHVLGQAQGVETHGDPVGIVGRTEARGDIGADRLEVAEIRLLRQVAQGRAGLQEDFAAVGLDLSGGDLHQGRLARAVATDQRDALAGQDVQLDAGQERRAAEGEADAIEAQ